MKIAGHVAVSAVTAGLFQLVDHSLSASFCCFLGGLLIDVDHAFDCSLHNKKICWRPCAVFHFSYRQRDARAYLIFHSYELLLALWILATFLKANLQVVAGLIGLTVHLLFDQIVNRPYPLAYFWFYRRRYGFPIKIFYNDEFRHEHFKGS